MTRPRRFVQIALLTLFSTAFVGNAGRAPTPAVAAPVVAEHALTFEHQSVVDPVRLVGEPDIAIDSKGGIYVSGPGSSPTQSSHFWKSEDGGTQWHYVGIIPEDKSNGGLGGGDTELLIDAKDNVYGMDQEGLACNAHFRSQDRGKTWTYSQGCLVGTDRPWMTSYTDPSGNTTLYFVANEVGRCYLFTSTDGIAWHPAIGAVTPYVGGGIGGAGQCIGRPAVDPRNGTLYVPAIGVWKSANGGVTWTQARNAGASGGAGTAGFGTIVADTQGNLYQTWISGSSVRLATSTDGAASWTVTSIPTPGLRTNIFPWPVVGDPGRLAVAFYGTPQANGTGAVWRTYLAMSTNALAPQPTWDVALADEHPMHLGTVCLNGTNCTLSAGSSTGAGDRTLADFFMVDKDPTGRVFIVYNDDGDISSVTHTGRAYVGVIRQRTGPSLFADVGYVDPPTTGGVAITSSGVDDAGRIVVSGTHGLPPGNWAADPRGDAVEPFAPVEGPNIPAMDITEASVGEDGGNLTFSMNLSDLSTTALAGAAQGAGTPAWLMTWWAQQRTATGALGPQAHYFVRWLGGTKFGYGQSSSVDMPQLGAPAPKFMTYVANGVVDGTVSGNTISVSVPRSVLGNLQPGDKLDNVTAWTWAERGELPTVIDQAKSFSYVVGTSPEQRHRADGYVQVSLDDPSFASPTTASSSAQGWSVTLPDAGAGHHTVYARQVLSSSLYGGQWPDVQAGPVASTTVVGRVPSISISDVSVTEGNAGQTSAVLTISLSERTSDTVTAAFATADGTAIAPDDYASSSGTVEFAPGSTSATVTVRVNGDNEPERDETFVVDLSNASNATLADAHAVVVIVNDDAGPACTITGTDGPDVLVGTSAADVICGLGGNDTINGGGGNDVLIGGSGDDTLLGENANDVLRGQEGADRVAGGNGDDVVVGFTGADTLLGDNGNDAIDARDGAPVDRVDGGFGADTCSTDPGDLTANCP